MNGMRRQDVVGAARRRELVRAMKETGASLRWRFNRLRCMSPAEVSHRLFRAVSMRVEQAGLGGAFVPEAPDLEARSRTWVHASAEIDADAYLAAADRIVSGKFDVFALRGVDLGSPPHWNRDPKTGVDAPMRFGKLLDYRDPRQVGDIKYLWEINRHLHLVTLAQAYAISGDEKYFNVIRVHLESWFTTCPYGAGVNWSSALEVAIRLINWSVTWQLLGGADSPVFDTVDGTRLRQRWLASIYQHAHFVRHHFSRHSSANNHLIGEAAGLFIAALTWPHWPRMTVWRDAAKKRLEHEALLQNAPDGVNREQAVSYQQFVLDLLLLCMLAGKTNRQWFSVAFESRVEAMLSYLVSIIDVGGNIPMFGDSDDALAVGLARADDFCPYRSLLATAAIVFGSDDYKAKAGALDDKTRWLVGRNADALYLARNGGDETMPPRQAFPKGGYYILGSALDSRDEIRLTADAGPLGYRSIAAHGHADALSFTLGVGGLEFLIDPGTYAYHTQAAWRRYFRGTSAHNTLRVDGEDQSQSGGNFMWLKKARAGCVLWSSASDKDVFEGWQDGYMRLPDPVMHRRRIELEKTMRQVTIEDRIETYGEHDIELFFHCSERCEVAPVPGGYVLRQRGRTVTLWLPDIRGASSQVYFGSESPILGWVSRRFDEKCPAPTIVWRARLSGTTTLLSEIDC